MKTCIILTSQVKHLRKSILEKADDFKIVSLNLNKEERRIFPDGEIYMRIEGVRKLKSKRVVLLHSGTPKPNEGLTELELILQILKDNKIKPEVFFTYFPYAMQDKVFKKGETNVAENLIEKLVSFYKVRRIYIIDPHFEGRKWIKRYPVTPISALPFLIKSAKEDLDSPSRISRNKTWDGKDVLFLSPDIGGKRRTGISGTRKKRIDSFRVKITPLQINLKGKTVGVIDDMIKTGGTLLKFYEMAKKSGAKKIIALITHGVIKNGILKINKRYSKLYLTNTINRKEAKVDITDLILETLLQQSRRT